MNPRAMPDDDPSKDPHAWLEEVLAPEALDWVRARNAHTQQVLEAGPIYPRLRMDFLDVLNASDRIPGVSRLGPALYNFWQDEQHKRGLWRRTSLSEYRMPAPAWETVLDLDALAAAENESWVFHGATWLAPDYRRCLLTLSRGGADASVVREFDVVDKQFVPGGFELPEAKSEVEWIDADHLYVGTDFGPGSLTEAGYPRIIKRWTRGTPLDAAVTVFEGEPQDVLVSVHVERTPDHSRTVFTRALDFYNQTEFLLHEGQLLALDLPTDAQLSFWGSRMLIEPRSPWAVGGRQFAAGSLLEIELQAFLQGQRAFRALFTPTPTRALAGYTCTRHHLLLNISENVASRLVEWSFVDPQQPVERAIQAPFPGTLSLASLYDEALPDDELADAYFVHYSDFLTPDTLFLARAGSEGRECLKGRSPQFDPAGMRAEQHFAASRDGTSVPYFVVWPQHAQADGCNPTLLYGYGGFEISMQPAYSGGRGRGWLARGGVFVLANIRGGGEFGPGWHQAAVKSHKQRSYDDFIAVAEDLIRRQITSPRHLGIMGGSNGGLLVGAALVQRPDLFNAVVCQVPLLDMRRYHRLLAGASWMAEYGDPDQAADWAYISAYSPYQNLKKDATYPKVLITTSTRDDRVHPGHARKMVARMQAWGHEVLYYENIEGGHGGAADNEQRASLQALEYGYLWQQLGRP